MVLSSATDLAMHGTFDMVDDILAEHDDLFAAPFDPPSIAPTQDYTTKVPETHQPPARLRRARIPQHLWEQHRAAIEDLYIHHDLDLETVIGRMKAKHKFDASGYMYKRQLRYWNISKYYSQDFKRECLERLARPTEEIDQDELLDVNGRPLKLHRLARPVQRKGRRVSLGERAARVTARETGSHGNHDPYISRLQLQQSPGSQNIERLLACAQRYYTLYLSLRNVAIQYSLTERLYDLNLWLSRAQALLMSDSSRAFAIVNKICAEFPAILREEPFQLMQSILKAHVTWLQQAPRSQRQLWNSVMQFMVSSAYNVLGAGHPIRFFLSALSKLDGEQSFAVCCRYAGLLDQTVVAFRDEEAAVSVRLSAIGMLRDLGQRETAFAWCQRLRKTMPPFSSPMTMLELRLNLLMALMSIDRRDYSSAEQILMQQLSSSMAATGKPNGDYQGIYACACLTYLYELKGMISESEYYHHMVLTGAVKLELTTAYIQGRLSLLSSFFQRHGKDAELAKLEESYAWVWGDMDQWRL